MSKEFITFEETLSVLYPEWDFDVASEYLKILVSEGEIRAFRDEDKMKFKPEDIRSAVERYREPQFESCSSERAVAALEAISADCLDRLGKLVGEADPSSEDTVDPDEDPEIELNFISERDFEERNLKREETIERADSFTYVLVGALCLVLGGVIGSFATWFVMR
ncbi:MAG: hypothetical protein KDD53_05755 [Bdellovibrionales bacterium]|nr:hypothetical protein [Bdellovibrionales bacterium]